MPDDHQIYQQLGPIHPTLELMREDLRRHFDEDREVAHRVHVLEVTQTRHATYITLAGAALGLALSKLTSLLKFN